MTEKLVPLTKRTISVPVAEYATYKDRLDNQTIIQLGSDWRCYFVRGITIKDFVRGITIKDGSLDVLLETVNPWDGALVPSTPELEEEFAKAIARFNQVDPVGPADQPQGEK